MAAAVQGAADLGGGAAKVDDGVVVLAVAHSLKTRRRCCQTVPLTVLAETMLEPEVRAAARDRWSRPGLLQLEGLKLLPLLPWQMWLLIELSHSHAALLRQERAPSVRGAQRLLRGHREAQRRRQEVRQRHDR